MSTSMKRIITAAVIWLAAIGAALAQQPFALNYQNITLAAPTAPSRHSRACPAALLMTWRSGLD
jgi:hypothetical protein